MKKTMRILLLFAVLTAFLYAGGFKSALDARTETAYPLSASDDAPMDVLVFVAYYDEEGMLLSLSMYETTVNNTSLVFGTMSDIPPGTKSVKTIVTDENLCPVMAASEL